MSDRAFDEAHMRSLASRVAYPPTPDLGPRVLAALATEASPPSAGRRVAAASAWPRLVWVAAAMAIFIAIASALGIPSSREAIAEFFSIEGSRIEMLPTPPAGITPTPFPPEAPLEQIGTRVSLEEAARLAGFALSLPADEPPAGVFVVRYGNEYAAVLRYPTFDLWQARPREIVFGKRLPRGVVWLELTVRGWRAAWIEGGSHLLRLIDNEGDPLPGSDRVVAVNTLVWNSDHAFYRIETPLTRLDALRVAERLP